MGQHTPPVLRHPSDLHVDSRGVPDSSFAERAPVAEHDSACHTAALPVPPFPRCSELASLGDPSSRGDGGEPLLKRRRIDGEVGDGIVLRRLRGKQRPFADVAPLVGVGRVCFLGGT